MKPKRAEEYLCGNPFTKSLLGRFTQLTDVTKLRHWTARCRTGGRFEERLAHPRVIPDKINPWTGTA
jgi:hypothetical protein